MNENSMKFLSNLRRVSFGNGTRVKFEKKKIKKKFSSLTASIFWYSMAYDNIDSRDDKMDQWEFIDEIRRNFFL